MQLYNFFFKIATEKGKTNEIKVLVKLPLEID